MSWLYPAAAVLVIGAAFFIYKKARALQAFKRRAKEAEDTNEKLKKLNEDSADKSNVDRVRDKLRKKR